MAKTYLKFTCPIMRKLNQGRVAIEQKTVTNWLHF